MYLAIVWCIVCPLQLSLEKVAKHQRSSFRPPEPTTSTQTLDHMRAADRDQTEEEAMDSDGLEESDVGDEENTHMQQTAGSGTLPGDTTREERSVKMLTAENENRELDMEASSEEQRYSQRLHFDTQPEKQQLHHSVFVRKGGIYLGSIGTTLSLVVHQVKMY